MGVLSIFFFNSNELGCMRTLFFPSGSSANPTPARAPARVIAKLQGIRNNVHSDCEWEREYACISKHCVEGKEPKEYVIMGHSDYYFVK